MYNFSIPANFKAYIDQVVRVNRTFLADETGYKGLVLNKKMIIITTRGGLYAEGTPTYAYDFQTPYLRLIFGFIGITEIEFIHAEGLNMNDELRSRSIANARSQIASLAENRL